jgi:hypothetical protein
VTGEAEQWNHDVCAMLADHERRLAALARRLAATQELHEDAEEELARRLDALEATLARLAQALRRPGQGDAAATELRVVG